MKEYKSYELKIDFSIFKVKFDESYTKYEMKIILGEINKAIKYVFGELYNHPDIEIMFIDKLNVGDYEMRGMVDERDHSICIAKSDIKNINQLKNCICHELVHIKFTFENLNKYRKILNENMGMYYIDEFWACKISNNYSPSGKYSYIFKGLDLDRQVLQMSNQSVIGQKCLATSVCSCIIENYGEENILESNKKYLILKNIIEQIGFKPTEDDLKMLEKELLKLNLI